MSVSMLRLKKIVALLIGIITTVTVLAFTWNKVFTSSLLLSRFNNAVYDVSLRLFHKKSGANYVVMVDVDDQSLATDGKWPWSRDKIALLTDRLLQAGATVIAFDVLFPEADVNVAQVLLRYATTQQDTPEIIKQYLSAQVASLDNDKIFSKALAAGDVVLGVFFHNDHQGSSGFIGKPALALPPGSRLVVPRLSHYTGTIEPLVNAVKQHTGFVTTIPDEDGILRRSPILIEYDRALYPSLALEAVKLYLLENNISLDTSWLEGNQIILGVRLGGTYIPTDPAGNILIPYIGAARAFPNISASDVLRGNFSPQAFNGKLVIIGSSAVGIGDRVSTPLQTTSYPGGEVHANIAEAILSKSFISSPIWIVGLERVLLVVVGLLLAVWTMFCSVWGVLLVIGIGLLAVFVAQAWLWVNLHLVLPHMILPYLLIGLLGVFNLGYGFFFEVRYRFKLHHLYGQYIAADRIDNMLNHPEQYALNEGRAKEMSVLFSDVRGFTSLSEKLDANGVKIFLNSLFTPLTKIIFDNKGTIDKYVGDMVMAFWGDPVDDVEHAQHAVITGLQILTRVKELAPQFAAQGLNDVRVGVGINSGVMNVGDMGSQYRKSYTVLGDSVNLASRLESSTKFYGVPFLVSEATKSECHDIAFRFVDKICVKGKVEPVNIYEPVGLVSELSPVVQDELCAYEAALKLYFARDWNGAKKALQKIIERNSENALYGIYLQRVQDYMVTPPPVNWDWVCMLHEK
jgi:adenylate cyclase